MARNQNRAQAALVSADTKMYLKDHLALDGCGKEEGMETPEIEFLLYLLNRYIKNNGLDASQATVAELLENINMNLTPIGGG
jgi:hypothetical protein